MNSKHDSHSPGDWRYSTIRIHNPERVILLADEREIARIEACSVWDKEDEPNLRLMVSAPDLIRQRDDLVARLGRVLDRIDVLHGEERACWTNDDAELFNGARAALANYKKEAE